MKRILTRTAIVILVAIEIVWFVSPRFGDSVSEPFRHEERLAALTQFTSQHTAANEVAVKKELDLLSEHQSNRMLAICAMLLALDVILIRLFWNPKQSQLQTAGV